MEPQPAPAPGERLSGRQVAWWSLFVVVVLAGLVLFFREAYRIVSLLDVLGER